MNLAPIVLFVYNRLWHTEQVVSALLKNELSKDSDLFIYSDGFKGDFDRQNVEKVREYIRSIKGFKSINIVEKSLNFGLANNIIDGVTDVINRYGKVIVLEDDIVTSKYFLKHMNNALEYYQDKKEVWHISGWNYPFNNNKLPDVFLWRLMNCWGWATWSNRWFYFKKNTDELIKEFTRDNIEIFNIDGAENFWGQILDNRDKKKNTWAIYWYATIFKNKGLCMNFCKSLTLNIGLDGSGSNCDISSIYNTNLNNLDNIKFENILQENKLAIKSLKRFYQLNKKEFLFRIFRKVVKYKNNTTNYLKKIYLKQNSNPGILGIFINPFYFSRKGLYSSVSEFAANLSGKVLDVGCGSKPYRDIIKCDEYVGMEIDSLENRKNKVADYFYDGIKFPFGDNFFDSIISTQVLEHVFEPDNFLKEVSRVLKPKGKLILSAPLVWDEHEKPFDFARYTSFGLKYMLEKNSFKIIKTKKTSNDSSAIIQLITASFYKTFFTKNKYVNIILALLIIAPLNILGIMISIIMPKNNDFYLDNVILASKLYDKN